MKWKKLASLINKMTPEQQEEHVAVFLHKEGESYSGAANFILNTGEIEDIEVGNHYLEML